MCFNTPAAPTTEEMVNDYGTAAWNSGHAYATESSSSELCSEQAHAFKAALLQRVRDLEDRDKDQRLMLWALVNGYRLSNTHRNWVWVYLGTPIACVPMTSDIPELNAALRTRLEQEMKEQ